MTRCIHITPELPPTVGGVADYTTILSHRLVEVAEGEVEPVLIHAEKRSTKDIEVDFPVVDISGKQSAAILADTVWDLADAADGSVVVLLEYSGYGYAKRGAPLWLVRGLSRVCGTNGVPLVTMVHEVRASNWKPWTSTFWLSPVQGYVAAQLARMSRAVVTNRVPSAEWLRSRTGGTPVHVQPVFSNVGEPERTPPFEERTSQAVIFGGRAMKNHLYETLEDLQGKPLRKFGVDRIVDLGTADGIPGSVASIPVEVHGIQPASAISAQLQQARIGLLQYPVDYLTKSGIWASYAAHGLPSLVFSDPAKSDPLQENSHFLRANPEGVLLERTELEEVGSQARRWYQSTAHSKQAAQTFSKLISIHV